MTTNDNKTNPPSGNRESRQEILPDNEFGLEPQLSSPSTPAAKKAPAAKTVTGRATTGQQAAEVLSYRHGDKRTNNPHVGMVDTHSDSVKAKPCGNTIRISTRRCNSTASALPLRT